VLFRSIDGTVSYEHLHYNRHILKQILGRSGAHDDVDAFEAGFDAEWEIDLFGMSKYQSNALQAKVEASEQEFTHIWISLLGELVRAYVELRGLQLRLGVLNSNIAAQEDSIQLMRGLVNSGFVSDIDQNHAQSELSSMIAQKPAIELGINKAIHRLSVLLGYNPGELFCYLNAPSNLPSLPCEMPVGYPSELLRRRPDIKKAERELAAATNMVGSAIAAQFPRISLNGFVGDLSNFSSGSFTWMGGSQLLFPIFNSKLIQQDIEANKIQEKQALYNYQKVVLEALEETENAIAALNAEKERKQSLSEAIRFSKDAYDSTNELFQKGFKDYLEVQIAHRAYLTAEDAYVQSQVALLCHYVALYKALGGGWELSYCKQD
jgi:outer membrane protein, multidrug efflux system